MTVGKRWKLFEILQANGFNSTIQTAFIERVNLTIRQGVSPLTRRTWFTARNEAYLLLHVEWWRAYYHFARPHESLQGQTPAMKLGLTATTLDTQVEPGEIGTFSFSLCPATNLEVGEHTPNWILFRNEAPVPNYRNGNADNVTTAWWEVVVNEN